MNIFKKQSRIKWIVGSLIVLVVGGSLVGFANNDKRNFSIVKNLDIYYTLFRELNSYYVDETNPEKLIKTSIDEMLESLDPYTTYIPEDDMEDFKFMTTGEYGGMGSLISRQGDYVVIAEPYEGFPAHLAGLKAGDKLLEINAVRVVGMPTSEVSDLLKGPPNTPLKLKIERPGTNKPINIELIRKKISINPVPYYGMISDKTGLIMLNNFTQNCAKEVSKALTDLKENSGAERFVLDLRGNPGGLMDEAVKIVNLFVKKGSEVVSTRGKVSQWDKVYRATSEPLDTISPLVVLINRGSASASEIVGGSLQDMDRAVLIGQRSFGKGLVQTTRPLSYNAKLKVTTAKYYIPSGRCIQALDYTHRNEDGSVGLIPDSLITEFKTAGGRSVFDGGGVSPDIIMENKKYGNISYALVAQNTMFEYATRFVLENDKINAPENFEISDEVYEKFKQYVATQKDFKYESATQDALKKLKEVAQREDYYKKSKTEFEQLEKMLTLDVQKDLNIFRKEVSKLLGSEIVKRYYHQKGAIKFALQDDQEVEKAIAIVEDSAAYNGILNGTVLSHAGDKRNVKATN
ncbi:C-terminal processing peptidase-3. Serine peptidase. MEROPS family S41A [Saccharicrinis carchari]|uniref:C-terminal processing peptidase-3. Serine peptidase. MEROPS family S41A n=1 Tax=Saccharicrinis carchari TaxID=1168039 RepID=A0A521CNH6_SACCC|nr:S41 family peptidase [Saccharicrinis carchari]SMO60993.1 C-terminal processing peptidase-3. Serine peptidase. MEROPS family S41A [Saccharicrinis carchari]